MMVIYGSELDYNKIWIITNLELLMFLTLRDCNEKLEIIIEALKSFKKEISNASLLFSSMLINDA